MTLVQKIHKNLKLEVTLKNHPSQSCFQKMRKNTASGIKRLLQGFTMR